MSWIPKSKLLPRSCEHSRQNVDFKFLGGSVALQAFLTATIQDSDYSNGEASAPSDVVGEPIDLHSAVSPRLVVAIV